MNLSGLVLAIEKEYFPKFWPDIKKIIPVISNYTALGLKQIQLIELTNDLIFIQKIRQSFPELTILAGGAIKDFHKADSFLDFGADYIVIGRELVNHQAKIINFSQKYGSKLIVSVDDDNGLIKDSQIATKDYISRLVNAGIENILIVATDRILKSTGIDFGYLKELIEPYLNDEINFIYSGGISSLADVQSLKNLGFKAIIAGTAIYKQQIAFEEVIRVFN